jgi:hypothetical protein
VLEEIVVDDDKDEDDEGVCSVLSSVEGVSEEERAEEEGDEDDDEDDDEDEGDEGRESGGMVGDLSVCCGADDEDEECAVSLRSPGSPRMSSRSEEDWE